MSKFANKSLADIYIFEKSMYGNLGKSADNRGITGEFLMASQENDGGFLKALRVCLPKIIRFVQKGGAITISVGKFSVIIA